MWHFEITRQDISVTGFDRCQSWLLFSRCHICNLVSKGSQSLHQATVLIVSSYQKYNCACPHGLWYVLKWPSIIRRPNFVKVKVMFLRILSFQANKVWSQWNGFFWHLAQCLFSKPLSLWARFCLRCLPLRSFPSFTSKRRGLVCMLVWSLRFHFWCRRVVEASLYVMARFVWARYHFY